MCDFDALCDFDRRIHTSESHEASISHVIRLGRSGRDLAGPGGWLMWSKCSVRRPLACLRRGAGRGGCLEFPALPGWAPADTGHMTSPAEVAQQVEEIGRAHV